MFSTQTEIYCANWKALQKTHLADIDNDRHLLILFLQMSTTHHFNELNN